MTGILGVDWSPCPVTQSGGFNFLGRFNFSVGEFRACKEAMENSGALHTWLVKSRGRCPNSFQEVKGEVH